MKALKLILVAVMALPVAAGAVPVKFSDCEKNIKISNPKRGTGVIFNATCDVGYVLPPQDGELTVAGLSPSGNTKEICAQYDNIEMARTAVTESINSIYQRMARVSKQIEEYEVALEEGLVPFGMTSVEELEQKIVELKGDSKQYLTEFILEWESLGQLRTTLAKMEGATGKFFLESNYQDLVNEYQKKNPGIHFERIPLEQSYLVINEKDREEGSGTASAVISITVPKVSKLPIFDINATPAKEESAATQINGGIFTDGLAGDIVFSSIGICPLFNKAKGVPEKIEMNDVENYLAASVIYQYHVQARRKHSITYNLAQLAKRIESSSKKGGFLSTKTVHSLTETTESKKWINFETYEEDPTFIYTEDYKKEIKEQFLSAVLNEVAYVSFDNPSAFPALLEPGKNGVSVAGEAVGKCPHMYCQIASYALKFVDATFGKTSAISEYIRTRDVDNKETVNETRMVPYAGSYPLK